MKIKKAWTLAELVICITVLLMLAGVGASIIKPNNNKANLFVYAAIKNLSAANSALIKSYGDTYSVTEKNADASACLDEAYCARATDLFTTTGSTNCAAKLSSGECVSDVSTTTANMVLPNGVEYFGLANNWQEGTNASGGTYKFKDILVDIDGYSKGMNKIWIDRYPLRVYSREGKDTLRAVNCSGSGSNDGKKSDYCSSSTKDYRKDGNVIKYEIYRATAPSTTGVVKAVLISSGLSELEANCKANTWGDMYPLSDCAGYTVLPKCMNTGISCDDGTTNICNSTNENAENLPCFVLLQKPATGAGILLDNFLQEVDM